MLDKYVNDIIKSMSDLIKIKTVEDTPVEGGPFGQGNKECLEKALEIAKALGFKTKNLDGYCGYAEIGEGDEVVGIIGHLDVVPEGDGWIYPPYSAQIVDGVMYGRGTWDDKGPIVVCLYALKALIDSGLTFNKRVRVIFGCNEESGSRCVEHYIEKEGQISYGFSPDSTFPVIFGEKTINGIVISGNKVTDEGSIKLISLNGGIVANAVPDICTFSLSYECPKCKEKAISKLDAFFKEYNLSYDIDEQDGLLIYSVHGKACHGSIPQYGINAISYSIKGLKQIVSNSFIDFYSKYIGIEYNGKSLGCYASDEYGDIAVNIGIVKYENKSFNIVINSRLPFSTNSELMIESIKNTIANENNVEATLVSSSNGFILDKNGPMIKALVNAYQSVTKDYNSKPICSAGGTYAREFTNCVAFGPEMEGYGSIDIHQPNECIQLRVIPVLLEIYYKAIKDILS